MEIVGHILHAVGKFGQVGSPVPSFVAFLFCPAVIKYHVLVSQVPKTSVNQQLGGV
jgi:hypothetical protein